MKVASVFIRHSGKDSSFVSFNPFVYIMKIQSLTIYKNTIRGFVEFTAIQLVVSY